ncbi:MAG: phosphonate C-P lyase system protein PhnG [Anaerolineaceae bacterium]|nr:phosphonate C-P lyase system protein PhnG [Anaerolineaceae bacterium]
MPQTRSRADALSVLTKAPAPIVKALADSLLDELGDIRVLKNQTGLVMLPYTDSAQGTTFHLGEILVAEAHIEAQGQEGYGMVVGRDVVQAMALAVIDLALALGHQTATIIQLVDEQQQQQAADDDHLLKMVESTRVEMETF